MIVLVSLAVGMSVTLHKCQRRGECFEAEFLPLNIYIMKCTHFQRGRQIESPFYEILFLYTLTVVPARQHVRNQLCKPPHFTKLVVDLRLEIEEINEKKLLIM